MAIPGETVVQREARNFEHRKICSALGFAFLTWQNVEKAHFKLFLKMLGAPQWEVCSAAYYSTESFASRHSMVNRMAYYFMQGDQYKRERTIWCGEGGGLYKEIKDATENRNKLAHYNLDFDVVSTTENPDGTVSVELGPPTMRPVEANLVDRLIGRTPDKPEHNLSANEIHVYAAQFIELGKGIDEFQKNLKAPPPQQGLSALLNTSLPAGPLAEPPPSPETPPPEDETPSGQ